MKKQLQNTSRFLLQCLVVLLAVTGSLQLRGQSMVEYDASPLTGTPVSMPVASGFPMANMTATAVTRSVVTAASAGAAYSSQAWNNASAAPVGNKYITFTLTANAGYRLNLNGAVFTFGSAASGTGPTTSYVYTSVGGFASSANSYASFPSTTANNTITFTGSNFNNLTTFIIRIYGDGASAAAGTFRIKNPSTGNIRITGASVCAIPVVNLVGSLASPVCLGDPIDLFANVTSSPAPTYSWTGPNGFTSTSATPNIPTSVVASAGTYSLTISNSVCGSSTPVATTIVSVSNVSGTITSQTNNTCNGGASGAATVTPAGGVVPYSYNWQPSPGPGSATVSGLTAGSYTVQIFDANGCGISPTNEATFAITEPSAITATTSQGTISCFGGTTTASVVASGGAGGYTYSWSPSGGSAATSTAIGAGSYTCTITDANTCSIQKTFTITAPATISASRTQVNVSCFGGNNGSATVFNVVGGTGPYTYLWSPSGGTGTTASNLTAGTYTCAITDANSCTRNGTFLITQPNPIFASTSQNDVTCNGGTNGDATVVASGGAGSYTYSWAPSGGTGATATGLGAGTYTCTISDINGCSLPQTVTITEPSAISASISGTNISCNGGSNGTASVTASGGTGSLTYAWAPSGGTAASASGLSAATYTCTITDANSCSTTRTIAVTAPSAISSSNSHTNVSCALNDGTASVSASGGTPAYSYSWSPSGGTAATATGLTQGSYTCTITDANSCTSPQTFVIGNGCTGSAPVANFSGTPTTFCVGGTVNFTDLSSNTPTSWAWTFTGGTPSSSTSQNPSVVYNTPGTYAVSLTATNGFGSGPVTMNAYIHVNGNPSATASSVSETCTGNCDGIASVIASGGTAPYTYAWSPSGGSAASAPNRCVGTYTCTVTDANGCTRTASTTVGTNSCVGTTQLVQNYTNQVLSNSIYITAISGAANYEYEFSQGATVIALVQRGNNSFYLPLAWAPLVYGQTYNVRVRALIGTTWGNFGAVRTVAMQAAIPLAQLNATSCNATNLQLGNNINIIGVSGATNYQYKFTDLSTAQVINYTRGNNSNYVTLVWVAGLTYGHSYSVVVSSLVGGVWSAFGPSCNIAMASAIPTTSLTTAFCNGSVPAVNSLISCNYVYGATDYYYQYTDLSTNVVSASARGNSNTSIQVNWANPSILANHNYSVVVASKVGGVWSAFGSPCTLAVGGARSADPNADVTLPFTVVLYPNPIVTNVAPSLIINGADGKVATVRVLDITGKEINAYQVNVEGQEFKATLSEFPQLSAGIYFMSVTVEDQIQNIKFIVE